LGIRPIPDHHDPAASATATADNVRVYHLASTQHVEIATMPKGVCAVPYNPVDRRPVLRAVLLGLDSWVKDNTPPPASRYPRIADGSLVPMAAFGFSAPGMSLPAHGPNPKLRLDYGPDFIEGIITKVLPTSTGDAYGVLVPKVDSDGNEIGGVRLPEISVPLGTATGWAVRAAEAGGGGELCYLDGSFQPLAKTKAERAAKNDPRPSIEEALSGQGRLFAKLRQAAAGLEGEGYILAEDVRASWSAAPPPPGKAALLRQHRQLARSAGMPVPHAHWWARSPDAPRRASRAGP